MAVSYKILTQADIDLGILSGGMNGATATIGDSNKLMVYLRGNVPANTVSCYANSGFITDANPNQVIIDGQFLGDTKDSRTFIFGVYASKAAVNPRTWTSSTPALEEMVLGTEFMCKYAQSNPSHTTVTIDMDDEGNANCLAGLMITLG
jgi:uncharacterized Zn-finger protein